jgi:hypothetical protein
MFTSACCNSLRHITASRLMLSSSQYLVDCAPDEESVIECVQLLTLWQLIAGPNEAQQGHRQALVTVVKQALIEKGQQGVQDGTARAHAATAGRAQACRLAKSTGNMH